MVTKLCSIIALFVLAATLHAADAQVRWVVRDGQTLPGVPGPVARSIGCNPVINDAGQIVLSLKDHPNHREDFIVRIDGARGQVLLRKGAPSPDGNGVVGGFNSVHMAIDAQGRAMTQVNFDKTVSPLWKGDNYRQAYVRCDGKKMHLLARQGPLANQETYVYMLSQSPCFNDEGQVLFDGKQGYVAGPASRGNLSAIILGGDEGPRYLALEPKVGGRIPDGPTQWIHFSDPVGNNKGEAAFAGLVNYVRDPYRNALALVTAEGQKTLAQTGKPGPDGRIYSGGFHELAINDKGQVAFCTNLGKTAEFRQAKLAVCLVSGTQTVVLAEAPTDNSTPRLREFSMIRINNLGQVAMRVLDGGYKKDPGARNDYSLVLHDGQAMRTIIAVGDPAPGGGGQIEEIRWYALNETGQIAMLLVVSRDDGKRKPKALYLHDPQRGMIPVAEEGQKLQGQVLEEIDIRLRAQNASSGFNNKGQMVFETRAGVVLWTPPTQ
ncbi:MAG: choice-of-anchor tandem repeat NxxGxxAF-containing protein [Phycisphaeraceae bacterium]